jgi:tetratricopeptide (TPR) repeat protein
MNVERLKITALKHEKREDWRKAIDVYLKVIEAYESGAAPSQDFSIYNRLGDLYIKINNTALAVQSYERAVDLYTDQGRTNQAIALCGKVLRVNPGRVQVYIKLAGSMRKRTSWWTPSGTCSSTSSGWTHWGTVTTPLKR